MEIKYLFAEKYTKYPGGRYIRLGPFSGEDFREKVLEPIFKTGKTIEIDATGIDGSFNPSFLDEAFAEMAKRYGIDKFRKTVKLYADDNKQLEDKMMFYVNQAIKND